MDRKRIELTPAQIEYRNRIGMGPKAPLSPAQRAEVNRINAETKATDDLRALVNSAPHVSADSLEFQQATALAARQPGGSTYRVQVGDHMATVVNTHIPLCPAAQSPGMPCTCVGGPKTIVALQDIMPAAPLGPGQKQDPLERLSPKDAEATVALLELGQKIRAAKKARE